jgi:hypothetical protein
MVVMSNKTYRVRFRFHLHKQFNMKERERHLTIAGRAVVLAASMPDTDIENDYWLVMNARNFENEEAAKAFGKKLKRAVDLSSAISRLGVDSGVDKATTSFSTMTKDAAFAADGTLLRDDVHGVDVFQDQQHVRIGQIRMVGMVRAPSEPFLTDLDSLYKVVDGGTERARDIVLLLNYALTRRDPVAQFVFAISAVEMLGQEETWSDSQRKLLAQLASAAEDSTVASSSECREVADAIRRSTQKISLRQGVIRLLESLGLTELRKKWDELYEERSRLVHGLAPQPGVRYDELAFRTVSLCARILLTAVAREIEGADRHLEKFYPLG